MGKHETYANGTKMDFNDFLDFRDYATKTDLDTAAADWGSAEVGRICWCTEENRYYYWDGSVLIKFPSTGGAGAPVDATYVTTGAEPGLNNEALHKDLVGANLHVTKAHASEHENAGGDEISVAGLSGLLADEQDAGKIKSKTIDALVGNRYLYYDGATMTWASLPGGGDMDKATYDTNDDGVVEDSDKLEASTKAQVQDHTPKVHKDSHKTGGSDAFLTTDVLDAQARVDLIKNSDTGTVYGPENRFNFIFGNRITGTVDDTSDRLNVRFDVTGGATYKLAPTYTIYYIPGTGYYYAMDEDGNVSFSSTAGVAGIINDILDAISYGWIHVKTPSTGVSLNVEEKILVDKAVKITGDNWGTIFKAKNSLNDDVFEVTADKAILDCFSIDGNTANNTSGHGIYSHANNEILMRLSIDSCDEDGIHCGQSSWNSDTIGGKIIGCRISGCDNGLYMAYTATDYEVMNMLINSCSGSGKAGLVVDSDNCRYANMHLWGNYHNLELAPVHHVSGLAFNNIGFMDNTNHNVNKDSALTFKNSHFTGCHFWGKLSSGSTTRDTFYVSSSGSMRCVAVVGNSFRGEDEDGNHDGRYAVNWGSNVDYCTFIGNTIEGFSDAAGYTISGGTGNEDAHNTVYDCG
jgi:hypothetical protein